MNELSLSVRDTAGLNTLRPVTGGVPIAEGAAPQGCAFALRDERGAGVPLQTKILSHWKDGSARWVLLDFQSAPPAKGRANYVLSWSQAAASTALETPARTIPRGQPVLQAGNVALALADEALASIWQRLDLVLSLTDGEGQECEAVVESATVEEAGALRSTLALAGAFRTPAGERVFQFRLRASLYAGLPLVRLEPLILVDNAKGVIQRIRALSLTLRPRNGYRSARIGGEPSWQGPAGSPVRLFQYSDRHYTFEGAQGAGSKAPGWGEIEDGQGTLAVALREFWQQWPKSIELTSEGLTVGLFPRFAKGDYDAMQPWYKHQYLFDGECYRLRNGQARRWDLWVSLAGDGAALARAANAPLIPSTDPTQAIATGVWDAIAPAGTPAMAEYDAWAENLFNAYCNALEVQRDYGAMNWGDWFGERKVNWGNHEYDTPNQILIQFARTGDPKYFYIAEASARHLGEVDTVHHVNPDLAQYFANFPQRGYPPRPGMMHQHAVGHVGGFYSLDTVRQLLVEQRIEGDNKNPYLCLDPFNLGHVFTQGMARQYLLTGDPFLKETVERIGDNVAQLVEDRVFKFMGHTHCGRIAGWSLLALAGAYEIGLNERYLKAMRTLADDALRDQDPVCGGWLIHPMASDHCLCKTARHTGMAGFITAVLINGLSRYYLLSGDERLPKAIEAAVTFLDNDTWREEWRDWRYTSCPATKATHQPGVVVMAHVNAIRIRNAPEHLRILRVAWKIKFERLLQAPSPGPGVGKEYTSIMYGCAEAIGLLTMDDGR